MTDVKGKGRGPANMDPSSSARAQAAYLTKEKFKGNFGLLINVDLPMGKKIEKYAADPVVFYLHKNRNFIKKL